MLLRRLVWIGLVLISLSAGLRGQTVDPLTSKTYLDGLSRLSDNLPDLAAEKFASALAGVGPDAKGVTEIKIHLGEALVRAGRAEEALKTLTTVSDHPGGVLWTAYAHLVMGNLRAAEAEFNKLSESKDQSLRDTANLARARLLSSLHDDRELGSVFQSLGKSSNKSIVAESQLLHASILLEKPLLEDCAKLLPAINSTTPSQEAYLSFLTGKHALAIEDFTTAEARFRPLTQASSNLSKPVFQSASLAYAESLHELKKDDQAVEFLLTFLSENQNNLFLETCFAYLTQWSRQDEILRGIVLQRLQVWSAAPAIASVKERQNPDAWARPGTPPLPAPTLMPYALFHRALLLAEENKKESVSRAKFLLSRLRLEAPQSKLVPRSLLETSRLHLAEQNRDAALSSLRSLAVISDSPPLLAHAAELEARIQFEEEDFSAAAESFAQMREHLAEAPETVDLLNEGISLLLANDQDRFGKLLESQGTDEVVLALQLERTLLQASNLDKEAREKLDQFLRSHGEHPRSVEARIALAELSVFHEPRDLEMAIAQLEAVDPIRISDPLALRHLLTHLRLAELSASWEKAIAVANGYLTSRPDAALKPAVRLKLGEAFFLNNDSGKAQLAFQQVANDPDATDYHEIALFFAARAAIKVTTPEARNEAIALFERVLKLGGSLANDARIQLAHTHLDAGEYDLAIEMLSPLINAKEIDSRPLDALLLQAEALYGRATSESDEEALKIYDACLARKDLQYAVSNRIHYRKGLVLEQAGRRQEAIDTFYRVANRENLPEGAPVTEWAFYYDCGFKAIRLLEEDEKWPAALSLARKLARSGGPKGEDATKRARAIQLEHQLLEDE